MSAFATKAVLTAGGIVPVTRLDSIDSALAVVDALLAGGCKTIEVVLRTAKAIEIIEALAKSRPEIIVGAGTITSVEQMRQVVNAGAQFLVSPGCHNELLDSAIQLAIPYLPGIMTASEIITAKMAGFQQLKFFPAQQAGGVAMLKTFAGVFPDIGFCPTGGINLTNAPTYLELANVINIGGSWIVDPNLIAQGDWTSIKTLCAEANKLLV